MLRSPYLKTFKLRMAATDPGLKNWKLCVRTPPDLWKKLITSVFLVLISFHKAHLMKPLKQILLVLILLSVSITAFGQKSDNNDGTIFVGQHFSFALKAPAGWMMDTEIAKSQHLQAVLYRQGSSWKDAVAVMYVRVIYKDETRTTVEKVISNDVDDFLKLSKDSTVSNSASLETRDKKKGISKIFYDAANRNYESVAFIDEPKVVVILALSSRNQSEYEKSLPAFKTLVGSYFFFTPLVSP